MGYIYKPYIPKRERKIKIVDIEGYRDFETDKMVPYLLGVYDPDFIWHEKTGYTFIFQGEDCVNKFLDNFITHKYRSCIFYAHFGSIFDFPLILEELNKRPFNIYPIMKGTKIIKITIRDDNNDNWYLHDSSALLNFSLDELTKTFNVEYKKLHVVEKNDSYDRALYELYLKNPKTVIEYLKHDCIGLHEVLIKFKQQILDIGGDMGITIASTSLKTFNHKYQKNPLYMCSKELNDEFRKAYYGGRTEIFIMYAPEKEGPYSYYDINSLYPTVMEKNQFPTSQPMMHQFPKLSLIKEEEGITLAKVSSPDKLYVPLLPSRVTMKYENKMMFVLGSQEKYWDNVLLRKAIDLGYKVEPIKSYTFKTDFIFKEFIHDFYKIKQEARKDSPMYLIAKLLMNSLYGKFGQHQISQLLIKDSDPDTDKYKILSYEDYDSGWVKVEEEGKGKSYLPQISVHVTALAQLFLYESIEKILEKDYRVFYCDTDSMITDYNNMKVSKLLGDWKLEKPVIAGYFVLPKTYKIIGEEGKIELRAKGYSKRLQDKISSDAFEKAILNQDFTGFKVISDKKEMLRAKASFHRYHEFNHLDYIRKSIQSKYNKRKILKNLDTSPWEISEIEKV